MKIIGFSRKGVIYIEHHLDARVFSTHVNHPEAYMLDNFSDLPEFDTMDEFFEHYLEGDYTHSPEKDPE
jgi:hypothetical protein